MSGDIEMSDLQALYSPRPPAADTYQAIPANPSWLQHQENPAGFSKERSHIADRRRTPTWWHPIPAQRPATS